MKCSDLKKKKIRFGRGGIYLGTRPWVFGSRVTTCFPSQVLSHTRGSLANSKQTTHGIAQCKDLRKLARIQSTYWVGLQGSHMTETGKTLTNPVGEYQFKKQNL